MGKRDKKKDKKKGKGAEKTAAKTEKKSSQKLKKQLAEKGEEDIEQLIAKFKEEDKRHNEVIIEASSPPSERSGCTLCAHPEREELLLFGGEYFNGNKTFMYNDLYVYNIKKNQWSRIHCPNRPPPRCAHQAVVIPQGEGQMWIFGGEFASPTRAQFYHYKDLWVYHISQKRWEQIKVSGGPSARSGHRMTAVNKQLFIFGGFYETIKDYKYYNDVYIFDLEQYQWSKIEPAGQGPTPRSACQVAPLSNGILLYGGYSKERVKKEVDHGVVHCDMFHLQKGGSNNKWKWIQVKQSGIRPSLRCGFSLAVSPGSHAYLFGGVCDEEENEETLMGTFYNDLYCLELDKGCWFPVSLHGKKEAGDKKRRRKQKEDKEDVEDFNDEDSAHIENLHLCEEEEQEEVVQKVDGIFTVTIGPQSSTSVAAETSSDKQEGQEGTSNKIQPFLPHPRMNALLAIKNSMLYMYGGVYENGDQQITLSDFHVLDLHKLDEWKTIIPLDTTTQEWLESESEEEPMEEDAEAKAASGDESDTSQDSDDDEDCEEVE